MSNLLSGHFRQYFQMPIADSVEQLGHSAYRYYGFLCREMNIHSAVDLRYSNAEIAQVTGIKDPKTIKKARRQLEAARLVEIHRIPPGIHAHVMLDQGGNPISRLMAERESANTRQQVTAEEARKPLANPEALVRNLRS